MLAIIAQGFQDELKQKLAAVKDPVAADFFDPATKALAWRGTGAKTIDPSSNPEKNWERLQKAARS